MGYFSSEGYGSLHFDLYSVARISVLDRIFSCPCVVKLCFQCYVFMYSVVLAFSSHNYQPTGKMDHTISGESQIRIGL